jgi:putative ABC transport system permease protein
MAVFQNYAGLLGLRGIGDQGEINGRRVTLAQLLASYPSFLGSPYIFVDIDFARTSIGLEQSKASFLLVRSAPGENTAEIRDAIAQRIPYCDVYLTNDFAKRSSSFWLARTGAGGGFVLTAIVGFLVGLVIVSLTMYSSVVERLREYATLRAIGATPLFVAGVVSFEAAISGALGGVLGVLVSIPGILVTESSLVPWVWAPWTLRAVILVLGVAMAGIASVAAVRSAVAQDPIRVIRG